MTSPARGLRAVPDSPPRAVIYIRQSTHKEESISLELQETAGRDYCARRGYTVTAVIPDEGLSGRRWDNRPGVQQCLANIENGDADIMIVWRWSRLARHRLHFTLALDRVETLGGRVESATEPVDDTTAAGRFQRGMLGEFAAFQSDMIGESWKEAHERRRNLGLPSSGRARFGYRWHRGDDEAGEGYEPDPDHVDTIQWMHDTYIAGHGFNTIANELNAHGIRNASGRRWNNKGVRTYLDSGFAAGLIVQSHAQRSTDGHIRSHMWRDGAHDAVIDESTWETYLAAREQRSEKSGWTTRPAHPLTGLTQCGDCGGPMNRRRTSIYYQYSCMRHNKTRDGQPCNIQEPRLYEYLFGWLSELADEVGAAAEQARHAERAQLRSKTDAEVAARELAELDQQLANLTKQLVAGRVPESAYESTRDELMHERGQLEERLAVVERTARKQNEPAHVVARGLLDEWDTLPVLERRETLSSLIRAVVVTPGLQPREPATIHIDPVWGSR